MAFQSIYILPHRHQLISSLILWTRVRYEPIRYYEHAALPTSYLLRSKFNYQARANKQPSRVISVIPSPIAASETLEEQEEEKKPLAESRLSSDHQKYS